jgi:hypothetical protein
VRKDAGRDAGGRPGEVGGQRPESPAPGAQGPGPPAPEAGGRGRRRRRLAASRRALNRLPVRRPTREPEEPAWGEAEPLPTDRKFQVGDEWWIARPAGESAVGHGTGARAYLVAVRFYREGDDTPVSEILLPRGRLEGLYPEELEELLRRAKPLPRQERPLVQPPRREVIQVEDEVPPEE